MDIFPHIIILLSLIKSVNDIIYFKITTLTMKIGFLMTYIDIFKHKIIVLSLNRISE